jgi:hypothetical protein
MVIYSARANGQIFQGTVEGRKRRNAAEGTLNHYLEVRRSSETAKSNKQP